MNGQAPPALSVVVPFHNVEPYLGDLLDSLANQAVTDFEAILVADAPTDGSRGIAEGFAARDARFRIIDADGHGPGPARNIGAAAARGDFLAFADGDDIVMTQGYARMIRSLALTGSSFAASNALRFDDNGRVWPSWTHRHWSAYEARTHIRRRPELVGDRMVWNKVFRRNFWEGSGLVFGDHLYEDVPLCLEAHLAADTVDIINDHSYLWRERAGLDSITQGLQNPQNAVDRITAVQRSLALVEHDAPEILAALEDYLRTIDVPAILRLPAEHLPSEALKARAEVLECLAQAPAVVQRASGAESPALVTAHTDGSDVVFEVAPPGARLTAVRLVTPGSGAPEGGAPDIQLDDGPLEDHHRADLAFISHLTGGEPRNLAATITEVSGAARSVPVRAGSPLPLAHRIDEAFVVWGAFVAANLGARTVAARQTAAFTLSPTGLTIEVGDDAVSGSIELRGGCFTPPIRRPLYDARVTFTLNELTADSTYDDPVRRITDYLITLDDGGEISQLYPTALTGQLHHGQVHLTLERTGQGAVLLRRSRAAAGITRE